VSDIETNAELLASMRAGFWIGDPVHGRDQRNPAMFREGEREPVEVIVHEVEVAGPG
jgi:hypothetical protein